jgi:hypothetical protein
MKTNRFLKIGDKRNLETSLTLVEIVVAVSILSIIFSVVFGSIRIYDISLTMGNTKSYLSAQTNLALNKMREELAKSSKSRILEVIDEDTNSNPVSDSVRFQIPLPELDANQNIQWGDGETQGREVKYYIGNINKPNQLIRQVLESGGGNVVSETVLANDVTNLQIEPTSPPYDSLTLTITTAKSKQKGIVPGLSVMCSTTVDFRN